MIILMTLTMTPPPGVTPDNPFEIPIVLVILMVSINLNPLSEAPDDSLRHALRLY